MLNLPVLTELISKMQSDPECFCDEDWRYVIEESLERNGYEGIETEKFKNDAAIVVAQKILPRLCKDAFKEFDNIHRSNNDSVEGE